LDEDNYLLWQQQVLATVEGLDLLHFLDESLVSCDNTTTHTPPPNTALHRQQDRLLLAWLLASMTQPLLTKMVGLRTSAQVWDRLRTYYATHTKAKIRVKGTITSTQK